MTAKTATPKQPPALRVNRQPGPEPYVAIIYWRDGLSDDACSQSVTYWNTEKGALAHIKRQHKKLCTPDRIGQYWPGISDAYVSKRLCSVAPE